MLASTTTEIIVPPHSEMVIPVYIPYMPNSSVVILEPTLNLSSKYSFAGGKTVCNLFNSKGSYRLMNPTSMPIFLEPRSNIAKALQISNSNISELKPEANVNMASCSSKIPYSTEYYKRIVK